MCFCVHLQLNVVFSDVSTRETQVTHAAYSAVMVITKDATSRDVFALPAVIKAMQYGK